jgi:hypothetical protein
MRFTLGIRRLSSSALHVLLRADLPAVHAVRHVLLQHTRRNKAICLLPSLQTGRMMMVTMMMMACVTAGMTFSIGASG